MKKLFKNTKEIIDWLNDWHRGEKIKKDQQMLSRFMKESKLGELSEEVKKWWINRYQTVNNNCFLQII